MAQAITASQYLFTGEISWEIEWIEGGKASKQTKTHHIFYSIRQQEMIFLRNCTKRQDRFETKPGVGSCQLALGDGVVDVSAVWVLETSIEQLGAPKYDIAQSDSFRHIIMTLDGFGSPESHLVKENT